MADSGVRSEDELGLKWDRCLADTGLKFSTGLVIGAVFSFALFKRRPWPVTLGAGFGLGMGYANCQNDFRNPYLLHGERIKENFLTELVTVVVFLCPLSYCKPIPTYYKYYRRTLHEHFGKIKV